MSKIDYPETHIFSLDAGDPALDFANTLGDRFSRKPDEHLTGYGALADFSMACRHIDIETRNLLLSSARNRPHEAAAVLAGALALREAIYGVATAVIDQRQPEPADLNVIARCAAAARTAGDFVFEAEGFRWSWDSQVGMLELPVWQIADAAIDLFSHEDLSRLRTCAADDCAWLFLDETRNRSRKWCDMSTCGNRAKVARYRRKEQ